VSLSGITGGITFFVLSFVLSMVSKNPAGSLQFEDQARVLQEETKIK
jgi:hypothetical protein